MVNCYKEFDQLLKEMANQWQLISMPAVDKHVLRLPNNRHILLSWAHTWCTSL